MKKIYPHLQPAIAVTFLGVLLSSPIQAQYCAPPPCDCVDTLRQICIGNKIKHISNTDCASNAGYYNFLGDTFQVKSIGATSFQMTSTRFSDTDGFIWIDWNNNEVYDDPVERVPSHTNEEYGIVGNIIPPDTSPGSFRMRVIIGYVAFGPYDPCAGSLNPAIINNNAVYETIIEVTSNPDPPAPNPGYCAASGDCNGGGLAITNVTIQGATGVVLNKTSGCDNYGNFTSTKVNMNAGGEYAATVRTGNNALELVAIYIDWNNNGILNDPGEEYPATANGQPHAVSITAPANAPTGLKRMRVRSTALLATPAPCGVQNVGEVEDYTVNYTNPLAPLPSCMVSGSAFPKDDTINMCQRINMKWGKVTGAMGYRLSLWQGPVLVLDNISVTDTNFAANGLVSGASYRWTAIPYNENGAAQGCDTLDFTVASAGDPVADIFPFADIVKGCSGQDIILDGNPSLGTPPFTHQWTGLDGAAGTLLSSTTAQTTNFNGGAGTYKYMYRITDQYNCSAADTVDLEVSQSPMAGSVTPADGELCAGESTTVNLVSDDVQIIWESSPDGEAWQADNGVIYLNEGLYQLPVMNQTTFYRAVVTVPATNCSNVSEMEEIVVHPLPSFPPVTLNPPTPVCEGETVTLFLDSNDDVIWNDPFSTEGNILIVNQSGSYSATVTTAEGCTRTSDPVSPVFKEVPPKPSVSLDAALPLCEGDDAALISSYPEGNQWSTGSTAQSIAATASGVYTVQYTGPNGCVSVSDPYSLSFGIIPETPVISQTGNSLLASGNAASYKWFGENGEIAGEKEAALGAPVTGNYTVVAYSPEGCPSDTSETFYFSFVGIGELTGREWNIYPQPVSDKIRFEGLGKGMFMISVINSFGQAVIHTMIRDQEEELDVSHLKAGAYVVRVSSEGRESFKKVLICP